MTQLSQRILNYLTLPILQTIINLQKCSVQSCHHRHKGSYTKELHFLLLQPWRQPYLTRSREDSDARGMLVYSGLYIPVSSSIHHSFLDLVIISPVLVLTLTYEPWFAAFNLCWYKATFVRAVISSIKPFSHVYLHVGACLFSNTVLWWTVQWCRGNQYVAFQGEFIFTKYPVTAGKFAHRFPRPRRKGVLLHPVSEWKKQDNFVSHQQ